MSKMEISAGLEKGGWYFCKSEDFCNSIADGTHDTPSPVSEGYPLYTSKNLTSANRLDTADYYNISHKDFEVINKRSFVGKYDILFGMIGTVGNPVIIENESVLFAVKNVGIFRFNGDYDRSRWFYNCLKSQFVQDQFTKYLDGSTQKFVSLNMLRSFYVQVPYDKRISKKICRILTTVDNLIEKTEALIAKYQSIKQGMMHDLFTRGIDAKGKLRPQQSEAPELYKQSELGWIPKEWEVERLDDVAGVSSGVTLGRKIKGSLVVEVDYLRVANVQDGYLDLMEIKKVPVFISEIPRFMLQTGDILLTEGGDFDKLGRGCVWNSEISPCLHQNHIFKVRPNQEKVIPEFLSHTTSSMHGKRYFLRSAKQTTNLASINSTQLKAFPVPLPSLKEQKLITTHLFRLETKMMLEGALLKKHKNLKTALMQDLLTGKVEVTPDAEDKELAHA